MADDRSNEDRLDTLVVAAVESKDLTFLQKLLDQRVAEDPHAFRWGGLSNALNKAVELARYDMADELFKRGATWNDTTIGEVIDGALEENEWNIKFIDMALSYGWDINEHFDHLGTALACTIMYADPGGDMACLKVAANLLSRGADANEGGILESPLGLACERGDDKMISLLFAYGATIDKAPNALLLAARHGRVEIMQRLFDHGADVNAHPWQQDSEHGGSALHCAVQGGHTEAVRFLLEKGATKDYRDKDGLLALDLAKKLGYHEIVQLIE
ncbi:ankyrin [Periconia macrospinosa]|uniref:Ankyrin n=1 Tax=Periconia macrospinosa TaxID=97972 RepID=A0A2V1E6K7_9PLEO|nr:ankyrin [Periconia macrospinosa]